MKTLKDDPLLRLRLFADTNEIAEALKELSYKIDDSQVRYFMMEASTHMKGLYKAALATGRELRVLRRKLSISNDD